MCLQVRDALTVGSISLSSHFFSIKMDVKDALKALGNEMRGFAILVEPPKTTFGKVRKTYSGKVGGEQDDACIALQLAVTGLRCFYTSERCRCCAPKAHAPPAPNPRLPQQVRALPPHQPRHDGVIARGEEEWGGGS